MSRIWLKAAWGARRNTPLARYIRIVEVRGSNPLSSTKSKEVEPIKWFGFFLWHGYCVPCFTTDKFIEEAAAVMDYRLAALLEKS